MRRRSRDDHDPDAEEVVAEAQALLAGRLAACYDAKHDPVPGWAWVNCLAHASIEDLNELAEGTRIFPPSGWAGASSFLAHELITGRTPEGVAGFQRAALIPLELDLLASHNSSPASPSQLVRLVQALDEHQRQQRSH